jgi:methylglutaconyl-CoA hydratase
MRPFLRLILVYLGCDVMNDQPQVVLTIPKKGIALITLNRPEKRNALNGPLIHEWFAILQNVAEDKNIFIVLLNGNGEHFCAGADIAWMQKMAQCTHDENVQEAIQLAMLLQTIHTFPKPVIGLIQGAAMGGGLGVMACCDIVIAAENATFCFSEAKIGLTPSVISPYVISVIGERAARYYFLTADKFNAENAKKLNLVQRIVPLAQLNSEGLSLAETLLKNSPYSLVEGKKIIKQVVSQPISAKLIQMTAEHLAMMRSSSDAKEGLEAFLEKRAPIWK